MALAATAPAPAWPPSWDALGDLGGNRHSRVSLLLRERKRRRPSAPHRCLHHLAVPKPSRPPERGRRLALSLRTRGRTGVQHVLPPAHSRLGTRSARVLLWEHQHPAAVPRSGVGVAPTPRSGCFSRGLLGTGPGGLPRGQSARGRPGGLSLAEPREGCQPLPVPSLPCCLQPGLTFLRLPSHPLLAHEDGLF